MLELNGTLIAVILNFIILVWILNRFLYKPVLKLLDERKKSVEDMISDAKNKLEEAQTTKKQYDSKIAGVTAEGRVIIEKANKYSEQIKKEAIESARQESIEIRKRAQVETQNIKQEAMAKIKETVAALSIMIASKILKRNITADDQKQFIDDFVEKFDYSNLN